MAAVLDTLLWLHLMGLTMGVGGGIAISRVAPMVIAAPAQNRQQLRSIEQFLARIIETGLAVLIVTGPLMLWLKFGGGEGLGWPFLAKMGFVAVTVVCAGLNRWGRTRLERGEKSAIRLLSVSGPLSGISAVLAMIFAVITFH